MTTPRGTTRTQTQYVSASRMRLSDGERDTIVDLGSGKVILVDPRRKEYSETSLAELRAFLDQIDAAMAGRRVFDRAIGATASVTVAKEAGGGRKIAGYDTEQYTLTMGDSMRFDVWAAPSLQPPAQYFDARKVVYATMGPMARRFDRMFDELKKIKGFPLATVSDSRMRVGRRQVTIEATEVRKRPDPRLRFRRPRRLQEGGFPLRRGTAAALPVVNALVTTEWLAGHLGAPDLRVADVRWYIDPARRGRDAYRAGHIPGAVFLDMDVDLSAPGGGRGRPAGRHPWPGSEQVARVMSAAGIGPGTQVVAYDDQAGAIAARLWYLLRAYGHDAVAVLDGGLTKWTAEGRPLETATADCPRPRRSWRARARGGSSTRRRWCARARGLSSSTRAPARGIAASPIPSIPAPATSRARAAPPTRRTSPSGPVPVLRPPAELRARYDALGADGEPPIVYCGSGVTACHDLLALELAGLPGGRLYAGSWSEWSADAELPLATGEG